MSKKLSKTPKLNTNWLEMIARVPSMPIVLKCNNYYSRVFKRANYKLQNSMFWVVINCQLERTRFAKHVLSIKKWEEFGANEDMGTMLWCSSSKHFLVKVRVYLSIDVIFWIWKEIVSHILIHFVQEEHAWGRNRFLLNNTFEEHVFQSVMKL